MMEHNLLAATAAQAWLDRAEAELRPLSWLELTARLAAARDLRRLFNTQRQQDGGSFAPAAAERLFAFSHGEEAVNPTGSASCKAVLASRHPGQLDGDPGAEDTHD